VPTISIQPPSLADGVQFKYYLTDITASGGASPYIFSLSGGTLPPGITLSRTGQLAGTPAEYGTYNFQITGTDNNRYSGFRDYTLEIIEGFTIVVSPLFIPSDQQAKVATPYSFTFSADGGTIPYSYSVTYGTLPTGILLNPITGVISGTCFEEGEYVFRITATDVRRYTGSRLYILKVLPRPTITILPNVVPNGIVNTYYSQPLQAIGGVEPYTFNLTYGFLPSGITLTGNTIEGTTNQNGNYTFAITATDSTNNSGQKSYSMRISNQPPPPAPTTVVRVLVGGIEVKQIFFGGPPGVYRVINTAPVTVQFIEPIPDGVEVTIFVLRGTEWVQGVVQSFKDGLLVVTNEII
jgi:hypothetical protein